MRVVVVVKQNLFLGVILTILSTIAYSSQVAIIKAQAADIPLALIVFMQSAFALLFLLPVIFRKGFKNAVNLLATQKISLHIARAVASLAISYFLFSSVKYIPLVNAILLANTAPLIVPFIAFLFMGQTINHNLWLPILIGFVGITLVLHPSGQLFHAADFLALAAAVGMSISVLLVRHLAATDSIETITFYFFLLSTIISGVIALPFMTAITLKISLILLVVGGLYFICQYMMSHALGYISAQLASTLFYCNIINSAIISALFFQQLPTWMTMTGIILTVSGGILCINAERMNHKRQQGSVYAEAN
jgi:drug/metabolite transporter (DMT)-like permease